MKKAKDWFTRARTANLLMASFIIMTSVGAFFIDISVGFITLGVASGVLGFLLEVVCMFFLPYFALDLPQVAALLGLYARGLRLP